MQTIQADYAKNRPEGNWFDADTMRYWGTTFVGPVLTRPYDDSRAYFITEDDNFEQTKRLFSVRAYDFGAHDVDTISFQKDATLEEAILRAKFISGAKA